MEIPTRACFSAEGTLRFGHDCDDALDKPDAIHNILQYVELIILPPVVKWEQKGTSFLDRVRDSARQLPLIFSQTSDTARTVTLESGQTFAYTPTQLISGFLDHIQSLASIYFNQTITSAIVTVPSYYTYDQRAALRSVSTSSTASTSTLNLKSLFRYFQSSSLEILRVPSQSTAVVYAHGLLSLSGEQNILTYHLNLEDLTDFEVTASFLEDGVSEILGSSRMEFEDRVVEWLVEELGRNLFPDQWRWYDKVLELPGVKEDKLKAIARNARVDLLSGDNAEVGVVFTDIGYSNISTVLTRELFFDLNRDLLFQTLALSMKALRAAAQHEHKAGIWNIDQIVLSGKSSALPPVIDLLGTFFPNIPILSSSNDGIVTPETAAVVGAARQAVVAFSDYVSPDECIGCFELSAMDISVGLENGVVGVIIPRHSMLPTQKSRKLSSSTGDIRIYGGFGRYTNNTVLLGTLPLPVGDGEVTVKAAIDPEGKAVEVIVQRQGQDLTTTSSLVKDIPLVYSLWTEDEIIQLIDESVEYDRKAREADAT
ncbi:Heat shock protein ssb1 [Marasmius crinis-equi]|uniref:Heat shock protein ssb1 n=1 Tax=Marasmius crinis-equi TaxID=585013 RepID=A0ABR3EX43_9AGAR